MPSKKKKYNARFPAGRIKKIMQTDEEIGKVAQAVPVIISRTLELFVESLLTKSIQITQSRSAKTLTPSHMKQCILSESRFDFLKDLVKDIPDASIQDDNENIGNEVLDYTVPKSYDEVVSPVSGVNNEKSKPEIMANFYTEQSTSATRTPVIQYGPKVTQVDTPKLNFSLESLVKSSNESKMHTDLTNISNTALQLPVPETFPSKDNKGTSYPPNNNPKETTHDNIPPLIPISQNYYRQNAGDNLYIDEDYDN